MPKKVSHNTKKKRVKQDTLESFFGASSSPPRPEKASVGGSRKTRRGRPVSHAKGSEDGSQSSDAGAIHFEQVPTSTDEDDLKSSPRRPTKKRRLIKRRAESDEDDARTPASGNEETGLSATKKGTSSKAAGKRRQVLSQDDEDDELAQPRKRKIMKGRRPPSPEEGDEENLRNEVDENRIIESRLRSRGKKSTFQKNLERLKRRKRGQSLASSSSSSEDDEAEIVPFEDARPNRRKGDEDEEDEEDAAEDDTFIVEDDNAVAPELPAEFSMNTYQDLIHHFKIICQLFVHISVHPLDDREAVVNRFSKNQYFSVPLQIARRKLSGMRDSLVASSIWRSDFKKSLETFPEFEVHHLEYSEPGCDACHLGSRMSTRLGRLSGLPYDPTTFESFKERDSSDGDSDDDEDHAKHTKKEFNLGRFCAARTRVYHSFSHWEWALFRALSLEVDELRTGAGARGFVRVAYARGVQPPDDLSDADGIMDWLDQRGVINIEWQKVKEMMESARNLEMKAKRGEADDDE